MKCIPELILIKVCQSLATVLRKVTKLSISSRYPSPVAGAGGQAFADADTKGCSEVIVLFR